MRSVSDYAWGVALIAKKLQPQNDTDEVPQPPSLCFFHCEGDKWKDVQEATAHGKLQPHLPYARGGSGFRFYDQCIRKGLAALVS